MGSYTIQRGDTLWDIAKNNNTTVDNLVKLNGIANPNLIIAGTTIKLPPTIAGGEEAAKDLIGTPDYIPFGETEEGGNLYRERNESYDALTGYGDPNWGRQGEADALLNDILNRPDFTYNFNADAIYQQYKDKYIQQGKMAMADAMGQASAMTGGYGNSYAASVGNQAYQAHLNNLNDIIPDLYNMALSRYKQEGEDMRGNYNMLMQDYDKYMDEWGIGYGRVKDAYDVADSAYYNAANLYGTEQGITNTLEQNKITNAFRERELAMAEAKHKAEMEALALDKAAKEALLNQPQTQPQQKPKEEPKPKDEESLGWKDHDTDALKTNQEKKGGSYYTTAKNDVKKMIAVGADYKDLMAYAQAMVGNSYISKSEYMTLVQYIRSMYD